jgi:hypothetical protein
MHTYMYACKCIYKCVNMVVRIIIASYRVHYTSRCKAFLRHLVLLATTALTVCSLRCVDTCAAATVVVLC